MTHKENAYIMRGAIVMGDIFIALISYNIAVSIFQQNLTFFYNKDQIIQQLLIMIIWTLVGSSFKNNMLYRSRPYSMVLINTLIQVFAGITLFVLSLWTLGILQLKTSYILLFGAINFSLAFIAKSTIYYISKVNRRKGYNSLNIVLITDKTGTFLVRQIKKHPEWGYRIINILSSSPEAFSDYDIPLLPCETNLEGLLMNNKIDEVIFCSNESNNKTIEEYINICNDLGVVFRMYSPFYSMLTNRTQLQFFGTTPLLTISTSSADYFSLLFKRFFDFIFSLGVLITISPLLLAIAFIIKFDSPGKVFFKQTRVGRKNKLFNVYKFRTMVSNAEELKGSLSEQNEMDGPVFKMANDPRITKVGAILRKYSLDELPQFYNVLKGEMSVIGPRPPIPEEVAEYERWQLRRLSMRPGLSCIWQVSGRNEIPFEEWMKMDLEYIDNWSLKLDFVLLLKTVRTVFRGDGR